MSGRIPRSFIDELLARTDIVEVVDARVPLRRSGSNYLACCPFHNEKTPSFTVSQDKQFYHCFGCGAHGSAIGFLMEYERLGFVEAVEDLASRAGLQVPQEEGGDRGARDSQAALYVALERAAEWFRRQLREHPEGGRAVGYLKGRGVSGEMAERFWIGYAPPGGDPLVRALGTDAAARSHLLAGGLIIERDSGGHYDRFRDRVVFPIRDSRGRVIGFGGRTLGEGTPKYLNSPETALFHKGRELYGLYEARKAERHLARLLVVEGYMDVVALAQHGFPGTVATLGTATTPAHVERLFRSVPEVVYCFDGDSAGRAAAWKALEATLPLLRDGHQARFLFLPEGEDPDTLVRGQGAQAFRDGLAGAQPLSEYFFEGLSRKTDLTSIDGRARLVDLARPYLEQLPAGGVYREMLVERLGELAHLPGQRLRALPGLGGGGAPARGVPSQGRLRRGGPLDQRRPVRLAVALLLQHPHLAACVSAPAALREALAPGVPLLVQLLESLQEHPHLSVGALLERWRDTPEYPSLARLATWEHWVPGEGVEAEFKGVLARLRSMAREQRTERLIEKSRAEGLSQEEKRELVRLLAQQDSSPPGPPGGG